MFSTKNIVFFLAGAQTFHTLVHVAIHYSDSVPVFHVIRGWAMTLGLAGIVVNALIALGLLWWGCSLKK